MVAIQLIHVGKCFNGYQHPMNTGKFNLVRGAGGPETGRLQCDIDREVQWRWKWLAFPR